MRIKNVTPGDVKPRTMQLLEFTQTDSEAKQKKGLVENVLILGSQSRNNREYSREAMRAAVQLYENKAVYIDHPSTIDKQRMGRSMADRFGVLQSVQFVESASGPQIRGDLAYLETHPLSQRVAEDQERGLKFFGLSHLADGTGRPQKGTKTMLIESINKVTEVDLVTNPATAQSLMEAEAVAYDPPSKEDQKADESEMHADRALEAGVMAVLKDPDTTLDEKEAKIKSLFANHLEVHEEEETKEEEKEEKEKKKPAEKKEEVETKEQTATLTNLSEQVKNLGEELKTMKAELAKPKSYAKRPTTQPPATPVALAEQTQDVYPITGTQAEKAAWLKRRR